MITILVPLRAKYDNLDRVNGWAYDKAVEKLPVCETPPVYLLRSGMMPRPKHGPQALHNRQEKICVCALSSISACAIGQIAPGAVTDTLIVIFKNEIQHLSKYIERSVQRNKPGGVWLAGDFTPEDRARLTSYFETKFDLTTRVGTRS